MKNKTTKSIAAAAIIGLAITCFAFRGDQNNSLSKTERANGWQLLFDGRSTAGWHLYNGTAQFTVWKAKDGALVCDPLDKSGAGDLVTDQQFRNFDLKFDWKLPKGGNSGVFVNVLERKDIPTSYGKVAIVCTIHQQVSILLFHFSMLSSFFWVSQKVKS